MLFRALSLGYLVHIHFVCCMPISCVHICSCSCHCRPWLKSSESLLTLPLTIFCVTEIHVLVLLHTVQAVMDCLEGRLDSHFFSLFGRAVWCGHYSQPPALVLLCP